LLADAVTSEGTYHSRLLKGGAALDDTLRVVELWDATLSPEENLERIAADNLLGKSSRSRLDDVLSRVVRPRFVAPGDHVLPALRGFTDDHRAFRDACYYEAARADPLLADFAEGPLWEWWEAGRLSVDLADVEGWFDELEQQDHLPAWTSSVRTRAAQGLLSALRDFGVLSGIAKGHRKEIATPAITPRGFAYVAWREHEQGASSRALASSRVWRRWLLEPDRVLDLFGQAARLGVLQFSSAGSAVRIDWIASSLQEVTGATA
jgi:hypothetical protein